ncbi:hypothetical protein [Pseudarthrobacter sp. MEB009]|uniref:hypothetical protein n=1 Tax=Pseudarthrobacter sp. MEB009 TaxID=3040326 RepID=UPI0025541FD0|nr:hypothetical protein [Pseudarthrobacter sp. MEB009]
MPTMSQDSVRVLPMHSRSAMTLAEIRDAMSGMQPSLDGFKGGWASTDNYESNLRQVGVAPPRSKPVIEPATDVLPEMLKARFYFWDPSPSGFKDQNEVDPLLTRKLNAVDVIVTEPSTGRIGLLFSTRTRSYLNQRFGAIASLNRILQSADPTIRIEKGESHLRLSDEEIFLWLAVQHRDQPQLAEDLVLDMISGVSSRDGASRTADLRCGVDFERSNFLTAVAEVDTLGPIDISFVHYVGDDNHSYEVKLHVDGGFEIRKNGLHFPDQLNRADVMLETSLFLAYSLIPRFNRLYVEDATNWKGRRIEVIRDAMTALEERYKALKSVLQSQLELVTE